MCCEKTFVRRLHDHGLRVTPQRELVLTVLHEVSGHATVEEIYRRVQGLNPGVDLSTVYRTLELLQGLHLVCALDTGDGQRRYELEAPGGTHHHLLCRGCGHLFRVEQAELEPLLGRFEETHGFVPEPDHVVISGLCAACRPRQSREARGRDPSVFDK